MGKLKTVVKVTSIVVGVGTAVTVGAKKLWNRRKAAKNPQSDLERTFAEFMKEATKSNEATMEAVRLMDKMLDEMDNQHGVEPGDINCEIEQVEVIA